MPQKVKMKKTQSKLAVKDMQTGKVMPRATRKVTELAAGMRPTKVVKWADDIRNPENKEFVDEVAFNKGTDSKKVTQAEFNQRYGVKADSTVYKKKK